MADCAGKWPQEATPRTPRDPVRTPAQWGPDTRYLPQPEVLTVPIDDRLVLMDPARGVEYSLDSFGMDVWSMVTRGAPFTEMVAELVAARREPTHAVRARGRKGREQGVTRREILAQI